MWNTLIQWGMLRALGPRAELSCLLTTNVIFRLSVSLVVAVIVIAQSTTNQFVVCGGQLNVQVPCFDFNFKKREAVGEAGGAPPLKCGMIEHALNNDTRDTLESFMIRSCTQ